MGLPLCMTRWQFEQTMAKSLSLISTWRSVFESGFKWCTSQYHSFLPTIGIAVGVCGADAACSSVRLQAGCGPAVATDPAKAEPQIRSIT
jgi:hypothetical protein